MRRAFLTYAIVCAIVGVCSVVAGAAPLTGDESKPESRFPGLPQISAPAYVVHDARDDTVIASRGEAEKRSIASLSKLMTALIVAEHTDGTESISVTKAMVGNTEGSGIGLEAGKAYDIEELLKVMLVYSANDAAVALATYVGNSESRFVEMMNDKARDLDMNSTTFRTATGLDITTPANVSTAHDLLLLTKASLKEPRVREAVQLKSTTVKLPGKGRETYYNRNPFIASYPGVTGVKTGYTDRAGHSIIVRYRNKAKQNDIYVVLLGPKSEALRNSEGRKLLDWSRMMRPKITFTESGEQLGSVPAHGIKKVVPIFAETTVTGYVAAGAKLREELVIPDILTPPLKEGDFVGTFTVYANDRKVGSTKVYVAHDVRIPPYFSRIRTHSRNWREAWDVGVDMTEKRGKKIADYWGF